MESLKYLELSSGQVNRSSGAGPVDPLSQETAVKASIAEAATAVREAKA